MSTLESAVRAPSGTTYTFTSESVSEGHPDKVCDYISDSILDAYLAGDPNSRVACETLVKEDQVVLAGEITSQTEVDLDDVVRTAIREIGYTDSDQVFRDDSVKITSFLTKQSSEIDQGVTAETSLSGDQGAGDQGIMFGYASDETPELMPLPILLAHRLASVLADHRKSGEVNWLRPDSKTQVSVLYEGNKPVKVTDVLISTQHSADVEREAIRNFLASTIIPQGLEGWYHDDLNVLVNPTGSFVHGGPSADAGLTGRKIIVDTYGGMGHHGGGAFSGKDPSKVDRSGAYFCRHVAREVVKAGIANKAEVQVAYAIGVAQPISVKVETFGTGDSAKAEEFVRKTFDFRPRAIVETLDLLRPFYKTTTNYGHFGKADLPWEK